MIYLFDKDERLIKLIRKNVIKTALQKFELKDGYVSDRLTVEMRMLSDNVLQKVEYMAIQSINDTHDFHYFWVAQKNNTDNMTTLVGVQSGIEELQKTVVYDQRPQNQLANPVINRLLEGTNWQARYISETQPRTTNFYYISTFEALKKVCSVWGLEMQFFVEMNGNSVGARYIDFKHKIGKAVGKRVVYGHNALQILQEVERTNIYTALIGRGKGEETETGGFGRKLTFENVVWTTPVAKPLGQQYVEIPSMTAVYGIKNADGTMRPKIGTVEFQDETDPARLLRLTYEHLINVSRPQVTFKTSTAYISDAEIGDTIRVVRHDKHIDYETRIFDIEVNRLDNRSADVKLGDNIKGESNKKQIQSAVNNALNSFVDNELSPVIERMPSFLASADGKNRNWYTENDPAVTQKGKVIIGDIWFKPDPEFEGEKIMLRWTGEVWEEILRTSDSEQVKREINQQFDEFNESYEAEQAKQDQAVKEVLDKASAAENLAGQAKSISDQAKSDAANALSSAQAAKDEAIAEAQRLDTIVRQDTETKLSTAKSQAIEEAAKLVDGAKGELTQRLSTAETEITKTNDQIKTLAKKSELDTVNSRLSSTESSFTQMSNKIETEISRIEGKIPENVGAVNLLKNGTFENEARHWEPVGLDDKVFADFAASDKRYAGRAGLLIKNDPYRTITEGTRGFKQTVIGPFNPSEKLTFSADLAYTGGDFGGMTLKVIYKSATDAVVGEFSHTFRRADMSTGYRRFTKTIELPKSYIPKIDVIIAAEDGKVADIYITRAQLERGTIATDYSKSIDELDFDIETVKTTITQTAEGVKQLSTKVTETDSKISNAETKINQLVGEVSSKVSQTDFNKLNNTVSSQATTLSQQANQILLKADKSYVDNVNKLVSQNSASLKMFSDAIEARVLKTDFDTVTGRVTSAETTIKTIAGQIDTKLSRTDADKIVTNAITQSERGTIQRISEVEGKIPTSIGGRNLWIKKDSTGYSAIEQLPQNHITGQTECYRLGNGTALIFNIEPEFSSRLYGKVTFSAWVKYENVVQGANAWNVFNCFKHVLYRKNSQTGATSTADYTTLKSFTGTSDWQKITVTYDYSQNTNYDQLKTQLRFYVEHATSGTAWVTGIKVETGTIATDYSLAIEDVALDTQKFHEIQDTVNSHTRTISEQGNSISQVIQTAQGLVTRVENLKSGSRNYLLNSKLTTTDLTGISDTGLLDVTINISADFWKHDDVYKNQKIRLSLYYQSSVAYSSSRTFPVYFRKSPWYQIGTITYPSGTTKLMKFEFTFGTMPLGFDATQIFIRFDRSLDRGRVHTIERAHLEISDMFSDWSPAPEDGDAAVQAVSTQVSQLAGSWAVKNLTSNGAVLNQINLLADGTNRIDGRLTHITGQTLIDNAVIKDANIASLSASKMTTGTLDAGKVNVINLNASNITSGSLTADRISGGILRSLNGDTTFNLQTGALTVDNRSMINLKGAASAIFRETKYNNSFLMFNDFESASSGYSTVVLGASTDKNFESQSSGYTGLYISPKNRQFIITADSIYFQTIHNGGAGVLIEKQGLGTNIRGITYNPLTIGTSDKPIKQIFVDKLNNLETRGGGIYGSAGGLTLGDKTLLYSNDGNVELSGNDINFVYKVNGTRYQLTLKDILRQIGYKV